MVKTVALSDEAYRRLKELKRRIKSESFSDLILKLVEEYEKSRILYLKAAANELRLSSEEVSKLEKIISELRSRRWW
ncbi:MAG: antitoxin VapB family protein [Desulfurococcales archaeon]|nr:antitoxin VapB family protein [Desulfurococcales archaeon]